MSKSKKNPNLCTTHKSLTKGKCSIFRVSGLFAGKARVCRLVYIGAGNFQAIKLSGETLIRSFNIKDVQDGKINFMCLERGE